MPAYSLLRSALLLLLWPDLGLLLFLAVNAGVFNLDSDAQLGLIFVTWVLVLSGVLYALLGVLLIFQKRLGERLKSAVIRLALVGAFSALIAWMALAGLAIFLGDPLQTLLVLLIGAALGALFALPLHRFGRSKALQSGG